MRLVIDREAVEARQAGKLPPWAAVVVVAAAVVSFVATFVGPRLMWDYLAKTVDHTESPLYHGGVVIAFLVVVAVGVMTGEGNRLVRLAVVLPVAHVVSLLVLWAMWAARPYGATYAPLRALVHASIAPVLACAVIFVGLAATAIARGREAVHAATMVALVALLLVSLWMPIAARAWWGQQGLVYLPSMLWMLGPPAIVAVAFASLAVHAPRALERVRPVLITALCVLAVAALGAYVGWSDPAARTFHYFLCVPLALVVVSGAALAALGVARWLEIVAARHALRAGALAGTIADDGVAARVEIASWLRGPRTIVRAFAVATRDGDVLVPGGHVVAALDPATTLLARGESRASLRSGDRVVLAGFGDGRGDDAHPFRASAAPVARGRVVIARAGEPLRPSIGLALWRPSVAYLIVIVAIAIPALIGAATN